VRRAILSVGPRGAGKTTFCKEVVRHRPETALVERDEILIELFGQTCLDPYSGGHQYGEQVMWERVEEILTDNKSIDMTLILDAWCGYPIGRTRYAEKLRELGAEVVDLWYFVTPEDVCLRQYEAREDVSLQDKEDEPLSNWLRDSVRICRQRDFRLFHSMPVEEYPEASAFDNIKFINPCQLTFWPYADLLL